MNTLFTGSPIGGAIQTPVSVIRVNDPAVGWRTRPIHDLVMIRGAKGYSWLYWRDGSRQIMAYTIKHYESRLPVNQYVRVHQNCMVNRDFVQKAQLTHKGPQLNLLSGEKVIVSRRRWVAVKQVFQAQ